MLRTSGGKRIVNVALVAVAVLCALSANLVHAQNLSSTRSESDSDVSAETSSRERKKQTRKKDSGPRVSKVRKQERGTPSSTKSRTNRKRTPAAAESRSAAKSKRKSGPRGQSEKKTVRDDSSQTAPKPDGKASGKKSQRAKVNTDGAIVYDGPSFDGKTLTYLRHGQSALISTKIYGDYFRFYRIKLKDGRYGYIATIDVMTEDQSKEAAAKGLAEDPSDEAEDGSGFEDDEGGEGQSRNRKPMAMENYVGILAGLLNFKEKIAGAQASENRTVLGFKLTGTDTLIDGPLTDLNVMFSYGAPKYYKSISTTTPTGYIVLVDANLVFPFGHGSNSLLYLMGGPLVSYTSFQITNGGKALDLSELSIGGSLGLGAGVRFRSIGLRGEAKYLFERNTHTVFLLGVQTAF